MTDILTRQTDKDIAAPVERMERKFFVPPAKIDYAYTLLRQVCRPDKEYPEGLINSLYFDTPDLDQYMRSASGEFRKDKVRIRWYDTIDPQQEAVPVFLELKSRQGFASSKQRRRLLVPPQNLALDNLNNGIVDKTTLNSTIAGFGYFPEMPLRPVITITYWRYRMNEMLTGTRVSLDYGIRSTMITPDLGYREKNLRLSGAVIEVKGTTMELPESLRRIKLLDTDWGRFSKYSSCIDAHLAEPGTIARLSPNGRIL